MQKKYRFHCLLFLLIYTLLNFYQLPVLLKEVTTRAYHPDQFVQGSAYFNEAVFNPSKFDHINLQNFYDVINADSLYLHNYDFYTDAHFIASVYQAITTGRDIKKENGSYNFAGGRGLVDFRDEIISNNKFIPTHEEVKNMVGLYATAYNNIANLIYTVLSPPPPYYLRITMH